jgi:hypothetical protein
MDTWYPIQRGLVRAAGADPAAIDPLRLLRVPGYYHHKAEPFLVTEVWRTDAVYSAEQMLQAFPLPAPKQRGQVSVSGDSFWGRVAALDCGIAIPALNGHWSQGGESFRLELQANGNSNLVREPSGTTGVFVRPDGSLGNCAYGSRLGGWLYWYLRDWGQVAKAVREVFPEVASD